MTSFYKLVQDLRGATHAGKTVGWPAIDALIKQSGPEEATVEIGTLLSQRTREGLVEIAINGETTQMDVRKARDVCANLHGAIEAAISDQLIYAFLAEKVGLDPEQAARALVDFREMRQGTKGVAWPM